MELKPRLPPGHARRKARRYVLEIHRLRAEGHSLESIRQALLDVGVSVSVSAVRREACRPLSKWELERSQHVPAALEESQPALDTALSLRQLGASTGEPASPAGDEPSRAKVEGDRRTFGLLSRVLRALRRLRAARHVP
jgi:hypothetical protein